MSKVLLALLSSCAFLTLPVLAADSPWTFLPVMPDKVQADQPWIRPQVFKAYELDDAAMRRHLADAPLEVLPLVPGRGMIFELPRPDGGFSSFRLLEAPIMEPELAAKFPDIKTYEGQGIDDPAAVARIDMTPLGFHAMVLSPSGDYFIDPYSKGDVNHYGVYFKNDFLRMPFHKFFCGTNEAPLNLPQHYGSRSSGNVLRTFRLACAATGEFTATYGGTVAGAMAGIVTGINRVTGVYEREVAIRLVLVANNNLIVYTNAATDPYTGNDVGAMLGENQTNLTSVIGNANYDIGHVMSTGSGGVAGLGVVCNSSRKAMGATGLDQPTGDPFFIDFVAHEMGHEFGGTHTFNGTGGSCQGNRTAASAYEPGSASTIMGYAGICDVADDLQPHSDDVFHFRSYDEILAYAQTVSCNVAAQTGNNIPVVNAGSDYYVPQNTLFTVTAASASDADGDALTYCWEERDLGPALPASGLSSDDNGTSPIFRSFAPVTSPSRTFPRYSDALTGTLVVGEQWPVVTRDMNLRLTIRDNHIAGGGVNSDDIVVHILSTFGPFVVTSPNTAVSWLPGTRTITWNVGNTSAFPFNASYVKISLSTDGGLTFPTVLGDHIPNNGNATVFIPNMPTSTARIRIEPANGIFFDVSNVNFTIQAPPNPNPPTNVSATATTVCAGLSTTLSATPPANAVVDWHTGTCTGPVVGTGNTLTVTPTTITTYFARSRDLTWNTESTNCATTSIRVVVTPLPIAPTAATTSRNNFCESDTGNIVLRATGGNGQLLKWYKDSCGGTSVGTGSSLTIASPAATTIYYARWENSCGASSCASVVVTVRKITADFDHNGGVDGGDIEAFFRAWEVGDNSADVNDDGGVDGNDVEYFFLAWQSGVC